MTTPEISFKTAVSSDIESLMEMMRQFYIQEELSLDDYTRI